jgi:hypothetical protein
MANWTVSLDKPPAVEPPNAVAYVTYASDDARTISGVRVPYALESDLLNYLARECARLSALDDRNAQMADVVATSALKVGAVALPDISAQQAIQAAQQALNQKIGLALQQKQIADAIAIDPTVADAQTALADAQTAISVKASPAQPAQAIGP